MSFPRLAMAAALLPCACHSTQPASQPATDTPEDLIACSPAGAPLARVCAVELGSGGLVTVRNPDGGFHKLRLAPGRGLVAADGAAAATVTPLDANTIEIAIGPDRYRLPATVKTR